MTQNTLPLSARAVSVSPQVSEQQVNISSSCGFYFDVQKFEHAQRVANMFAQSSMVPEQFRGNIGNCMIALNLADRFRLDPFMVMQKMYIVHGKPGIEAQLAIALINASGRFTPLEFSITGEGDNRQCVATAVKKSDGKKLTGPAVSIKMAKDEGWYNKPGSKWKTLPDLMLTYRAATFFGRIYSPEALLGFATDDEIIDITAPASAREPVKPLDVRTISKPADMSIYKAKSVPVTPPEPPVMDIEASAAHEPEQDKSTSPEKDNSHNMEHSDDRKEKALIRLNELSEAHRRTVEKHLSGRNPDNMSVDELWGVIDAMEDAL